MNGLFQLKPIPAAVLLLVGAALSSEAGLAMPFCCVGLGLLVGWCVARRELRHPQGLLRALRRTTRASIVASFCTFLVIAVVWGPRAGEGVGLRTHFASAGSPVVLHNVPHGLAVWTLLAAAVSPLLQLMAAVFASQLTILYCLSPYATAAREARMSGGTTMQHLTVIGANRAG